MKPPKEEKGKLFPTCNEFVQFGKVIKTKIFKVFEIKQ